MSNKKLIYIISIIVVMILACIFAAAFAYIGAPTQVRNGNINVSIVNNSSVSFQYTGHTTMSLTVPAANVAVANASNDYSKYAVTSLRNTTINLNSNATVFPNGVTCTYDIIYTPTVAYRETPAATSAGLKELVLRGKIGSTYYFDTNIAGSDPVVLYSSSISTTSASSTTSIIWQFETRFYNLNIDQGQASGQTPSGVISIDNVNCTAVNIADYLINTAPKSGTSAVGSTPWILTSDHTGEWRYAGKNPDNYIQFNNELWRIIGVMPNMTYCTGKYGTPEECDTTKTGSLVKIIRNQRISSSGMSWDFKKTGVGSSTSNSGSNDWSDSQLMLMLNGTNYLKTGFDSSDNQLHNSYTITSNIVAGNGYNFYNATYSYLDGNGTTVYVPSQASTSAYTATTGTLYKKIESSALSKIATVKWDLYGTASITTAAEGSPSAFYNKERNINGLGSVYTGTTPENRPVYWYGKIGLMYPSDYGYATNGGSTYNRSTCLGYQMYEWNSGSYQTDCALNSYLLFQNITSTAPGTSGTTQWTLSPYSDGTIYGFNVNSTGNVSGYSTNNSNGVRPVLYLKADTYIKSGTGKWNDPYII